MPSLAVAAVSARMLAESAAQAGFETVALDLFGDRDTRAASGEWWPIGAPGGLQIDATSTLQALQRVAQRGDALGWVAGSGFEALTDLLAQGAQVLPLIGTQAAEVRRAREPTTFFGFLDAVQIAHPQVSAAPPADPNGWLIKSALGTGGWHIRHASPQTDVAVPEHHYFQRHAPGVPMSATFIANGRDACVLGFNELIVRSVIGRPFVYCGTVGPVPMPAAALAHVTRAVRLLAAEFSLRGACSLDFMLDGSEASLLEVNPRPSASMACYAQHLQQGVLSAHVRACLQGELPQPDPAPRSVHGHQIVYARHRLVLDGAESARLAEQANCHDLPSGAASFDAGDPVCSVSVTAATAELVSTQLSQRREALLNILETAR
jgi:predicted ATP-grasp superfamily ATP-dependent carboligase